MTPLHTCTVQLGPLAGVHAVHMHSARAFGKHWHASFGFGLMDEGGQVSASGRGQVQALAGQIITTNPGETHDGIPIQQHARRWRMLYLDPLTLASLLGTAGMTDLELTRPVLDDPLLFTTMARLFDLLSTQPMQTDHAIQEEQLAQTCGLLFQRHANRVLSDTCVRPLKAVSDCLMDQMDAPPSLAALAELAGLSRYQLVRQFAQAHGLPPFAWLMQHRLHRAKTLIATGATLSDAALDSGFADQSHLTRSFMRYVGFTPGSWRRAQLAGQSGLQ